MSNFFSVITLDDIMFALLAAFALTYLIKRLRGNYRFIGVYRDIAIDYDVRNIRAVIESCRELFPREIVTFGGDTFKSGSRVQILTSRNSKITGELIGANNENMICLITASHIIAHELSHVLAITLVDAGREEGGAN